MANDMKPQSHVTAVRDGWIKRDARTGRFEQVSTPEGVARASAMTRAAVQEASARRRDALQRLANR